ncbi:MAG: hypothetical protein L7F78_16455, partial [Syntrophales bacterium LBB04]|nr:hypothetical protein [Syntrophales bacterium LBB04]
TWINKEGSAEFGVYQFFTKLPQNSAGFAMKLLLTTTFAHTTITKPSSRYSYTKLLLHRDAQGATKQ